jgi:FtsZ-interacting cell division protein ZipA
MSTGLIIAIVVIALILLALVAFVMPRMRRKAQVRARERELGQRRERVADEHRTEASQRQREAEMAEQKARMAQTEAERERAEAQLHEQRADMHERGMADDELIEDHEREHFAPAMGDRDAERRNDDDVVSSQRDGGRAHEPASEYEQGRIDEREDRPARFDRERQPDDASTETRRS